MGKRSKYQEQIIKNYYKNEDAILLQRLGELVSNLYLAEGGARTRHWKSAATALEKLQIPRSRIDHLLEQDDPALLARVVEELMGRSG